MYNQAKNLKKSSLYIIDSVRRRFPAIATAVRCPTCRTIFSEAGFLPHFDSCTGRPEPTGAQHNRKPFHRDASNTVVLLDGDKPTARVRRRSKKSSKGISLVAKSTPRQSPKSQKRKRQILSRTEHAKLSVPMKRFLQEPSLSQLSQSSGVSQDTDSGGELVSVGTSGEYDIDTGPLHKANGCADNSQSHVDSAAAGKMRHEQLHSTPWRIQGGPVEAVDPCLEPTLMASQDYVSGNCESQVLSQEIPTWQGAVTLPERGDNKQLNAPIREAPNQGNQQSGKQPRRPHEMAIRKPGKLTKSAVAAFIKRQERNDQRPLLNRDGDVGGAADVYRPQQHNALHDGRGSLGSSSHLECDEQHRDRSQIDILRDDRRDTDAARRSHRDRTLHNHANISANRRSTKHQAAGLSKIRSRRKHLRESNTKDERHRVHRRHGTEKTDASLRITDNNAPPSPPPKRNEDEASNLHTPLPTRVSGGWEGTFGQRPTTASTGWISANSPRSETQKSPSRVEIPRSNSAKSRTQRSLYNYFRVQPTRVRSSSTRARRTYTLSTVTSRNSKELLDSGESSEGDDIQTHVSDRRRLLTTLQTHPRNPRTHAPSLSTSRQAARRQERAEESSESAESSESSDDDVASLAVHDDGRRKITPTRDRTPKGRTPLVHKSTDNGAAASPMQHKTSRATRFVEENSQVMRGVTRVALRIGSDECNTQEQMHQSRYLDLNGLPAGAEVEEIQGTLMVSQWENST